MSKYFMISSLTRSALHATSRLFGITRLAGLFGLMGLLAACGGGSSSGGGGGPPATVTLSSISVTPSSASVAVSSTLQFTAMGKDLTFNVTWASSDVSKATIVASSGLATGVAAGNATITATSGNVSGTGPLTITGTTATLSSISVAPAGASVAAGLTLQFTATGTYQDGTTKDLTTSVNWTSSDSNVASIVGSTGLATGAKVGSTTITATYPNAASGAVSGTNTLTVAAPILAKVELTPNKPSVPVNQVFKFRATGTYTDHSTGDVTSQVTSWTTSNPAVGTIDPDGTFHAHSLTTTDIKAFIANGPTIAGVTVTVTGNIYAYATNYGSDTVSQYQVSATDGALVPLAQPTVATGHQPFSISVEPTGEYVYVSNWGSSSVSQFQIGTDGSLSALPGRDVPTGTGPNAVTIDHGNRWAYVANLGENTISQYTIGLDGQLSPRPDAAAKVGAGANPATIVLAPGDKFAYAGNFGAYSRIPAAGPSTISQYAVGADGALTPLSASTVASGSGPSAIAIDPSGKYLYVANLGDNTVGQYTIQNDGSLAAMTVPTLPSGNGPAGIVTTGSFVFVANQADGTISVYSVSTTDGSLTAVGSAVPAGTGVSSVATDPLGRYVYATNRGTTTVSQYSIGSGGALTAIVSGATAPAGTEPTAIATGY
jgi:6-phosphogluconolactonase